MMSDLGDLLTPDAVLTRVTAASKKAVFQQVAIALAAAHGLDTTTLSDALAAREKLGSTGFGGGVAIPHAKLPALQTVIGCFVRLAQPIDFVAVDDLPVDIVFALVSPVDAGADHLKALARVSRQLRDATFVDKLRGAGSRDALYALLAGDGGRDGG